MRRIVNSVCVVVALAGCGRMGFTAHDMEPRKRSGSPSVSEDDAAVDAGRHVKPDASMHDGGSPPNEPDAAMDASSSTDGAVPVPELSITADFNLSVDDSAGRSCADGGDMVAYSVVGLMPVRATLATAPSAGCLAAGDEVLLISMQGHDTAYTHVGFFELLQVAAVEGADVTFATPKQRSYGEANDDANLGTARTQQRVVLQRVPRYRSVMIASGASLRAAAWDGERGGVLALRVEDVLRVDGAITMAGAGYTGGAQTDAASTTGQEGESIGGLGVAAAKANTGGGGGGVGEGTTCQTSGSPGGGAGHVLTGTKAVVMDCNGAGAGAAGWQLGNDAKLLMGSGGGAGGTDADRTINPPGGAGGTGGGAIMIFATKIEGTGTIDASGMVGQGDAPGVECTGPSTTDCWDDSAPGGGGAGGTIRLATSSIEASVTLDVHGGAGGNGNDALAGDGGGASDGRIVLAK